MYSELNYLFQSWKNLQEQGTAAVIFAVALLAVCYSAHRYWRRLCDAYKGISGGFAKELEKANFDHCLTVRALVENHAKLQAELDADTADRMEEAQTLRQRLIDVTAERENVTKRLVKLESKLTWINKRYRSAIHERIWLESPRGEVPEFLPVHELKTPIISVFNLKGGVGKTTISANLAATYWGRGERVLLIDLDYQASLTTQCLTRQQIFDLDFLKKVKCVLEISKLKLAHARVGGANSDSFLGDETGDAGTWEELFNGMLQPVGNGNSYILPTSDALDAVEQTQLIQLVFGQDGVRFNLRKILHSKFFINRFDRIIIDCPPRLTSGSVNALAASHFVLIPVLPDVLSTQAAPLLIKKLDDFRKRGICRDLKLLGVVANKTHDAKGFSTRQANRWEELKSWVTENQLLSSFIPERVAAGGADNSANYVVPTALQVHFEKLADEVNQRINSNASL